MEEVAKSALAEWLGLNADASFVEDAESVLDALKAEGWRIVKLVQPDGPHGSALYIEDEL